MSERDIIVAEIGYKTMDSIQQKDFQQRLGEHQIPMLQQLPISDIPLMRRKLPTTHPQT